MNSELSIPNIPFVITSYNYQMSKLSEYLVDNFRKWEKKTGRKQSVSAWARILKVSQPSLTRWMNGDNPPSFENVIKLAENLGPEIYELTGYEPPVKNTNLLELQKQLDTVSQEQREQLIREFLDKISEVVEQGTVE